MYLIYISLKNDYETMQEENKSQSA
ncbi:hypothetical protein ALT785_680040 [Alteromonas infernus]